MSLQQEITSSAAPWDITRAPDRRWHDAIHEAARIAIGRRLGLPFGYAEPAYEQEGVDNRALWRGRIIANMAGTEAEREIIGWCAEDDRGAECDSRYSDEGPERIARMRRLARQLVKRHRATILRFADQLIAADELGELLAR